MTFKLIIVYHSLEMIFKLLQKSFCLLGVGRLLIRTADAMILYDIQALKIVSELPVQSRFPIKVESKSWRLRERERTMAWLL